MLALADLKGRVEKEGLEITKKWVVVSNFQNASMAKRRICFLYRVSQHPQTLTGQHLVCSLHQHELVGSGFIPQILVRMVFQDEFSVLLLDDGNIRILFASKHVVVALDWSSSVSHIANRS